MLPAYTKYHYGKYDIIPRGLRIDQVLHPLEANDSVLDGEIGVLRMHRDRMLKISQGMIVGAEEDFFAGLLTVEEMKQKVLDEAYKESMSMMHVARTHGYLSVSGTRQEQGPPDSPALGSHLHYDGKNAMISLNEFNHSRRDYRYIDTCPGICAQCGEEGIHYIDPKNLACEGQIRKAREAEKAEKAKYKYQLQNVFSERLRKKELPI